MIKILVEQAATILSVGPYLAILGNIFALAILLGGLHNGQFRRLFTFFLLLTFYGLSQELARRVLLQSWGQDYTWRPFIHITITAWVYFAGLVTGWGVVHLARRTPTGSPIWRLAWDKLRRLNGAES